MEKEEIKKISNLLDKIDPKDKVFTSSKKLIKEIEKKDNNKK